MWLIQHLLPTYFLYISLITFLWRLSKDFSIICNEYIKKSLGTILWDVYQQKMLNFISTKFLKSKLLSLFTYSWVTVLAKIGMSRNEPNATRPAHCAVQHVECLLKPDHLVADLHQGELVQASTTSRLARIGVPWRSIKSCTISTPLCRFLYSACNAIRLLYIDS